MSRIIIMSISMIQKRREGKRRGTLAVQEETTTLLGFSDLKLDLGTDKQRAQAAQQSNVSLSRREHLGDQHLGTFEACAESDQVCGDH